MVPKLKQLHDLAILKSFCCISEPKASYLNEEDPDKLKIAKHVTVAIMTTLQSNNMVNNIMEPQPNASYAAQTSNTNEKPVVTLEEARKMEAESRMQWNDLENKRSAQMQRAQASNQNALQVKQSLVVAKQEVKDAKERAKALKKRLAAAQREAKDARKLQKDYEREMNIHDRRMKDAAKLIREAEKREHKSFK